MKKNTKSKQKMPKEKTSKREIVLKPETTNVYATKSHVVVQKLSVRKNLLGEKVVDTADVYMPKTAKNMQLVKGKNTTRVKATGERFFVFTR